MSVKTLCLLVCSCLLLCSCSTKDVIIPLDAAGEIGDTVQHGTTAIADSSTAKTLAKYKAVRLAYKDYAKAYSSSGFTMSYQKIDLGNGQTTYLPLVSFKQPPKVPDIPDIQPHPAWQTANNILGTATRWGFGYLAVDSVVGAYEAIADNAGDHFYGDAQIAGSYNTAGNDQTIDIGTLQQDNSYRQDSDGCTNGDCREATKEEETVDGSCGEGSFEQDGTWWIEPGCSCSSREAGEC